MNNCRHFFFLSPNRDRKSFYQFDISSITGISTSGPTSGNTKRISFSSSSSLWVTLALALPNRNSDRIFRYLRMNPVNLKVRMVPIRQTVIKPHLQSFRPESLHPLPDQILAAQGRVQGLIVRIISFEQTKTFVGLVVITAYFIPAAFAIFAHSRGLYKSGSNKSKYFSESSTRIFS